MNTGFKNEKWWQRIPMILMIFKKQIFALITVVSGDTFPKIIALFLG